MGDTPVFAYLLLNEHPYGREMLRQMLSEGFVPAIIIEEDSAIGDEEREKFLKRIEGNPIAPTIVEQIEELDVAHVTVPIHNSEEVMPHIRDLDLDLIVIPVAEIRMLMWQSVSNTSSGNRTRIYLMKKWMK